MSTANCAAEDSLIGSRIDGRYTVHRVLGHGGMGIVYDGVHDELERPVAIKVLNAAWATDRTAVERFLREARTASSFSHSNIVDVSDLGRLADGRPYLVMPKIIGIDLATLLADSGPQPAKRVAALLAGVASALDLVHAKGFVHRDIKPENLMYVVREDTSETVMLLDFGIAAAVMSSGPRLTRQGAIFGTPHYLPPEVCAGARCDARGDVYSLAAVAFELITGELPFGSEDIMQLMAQKVSHAAPSLAAVSGSPFPVEVEHVIATGLARDPRYRYTSASGFVSALRAATHSAPVSWRSGVMRPSLRSSEHALPQAAQPGWDVERAPTWPVDSPRPAAPKLRINDGSRSGYASEPSVPRYADESSAVRQAAGHNTGHRGRDRGYLGQPGYPTSVAAQPARSSPPPTMNPGVWAAHAGPRLPQTAYDVGAGSYPTVSSRKRSSRLPILIGVVVCAGFGMGLVQLLGLKRPSAQTDARASTGVSRITEGPSSAGPQHRGAAAPAAVADPSPSGPNRPSREGTPAHPLVGSTPPPHEVADDVARRALHAADKTSPASTHSQSHRASKSSDSTTARTRHGAPVVPHTSLPAASPDATGAVASDILPQRDVVARISPPDNVEPVMGLPPPAPAAPEAASSVITVTPMIPEPSAAMPEPDNSAPAADPVSAARYAKQSSTALLRGEVTRAIELAHRATQADASYAIAWRSLGLALERAGLDDDAIDAYRKYLQRAPTGPQADMVRQRMDSLSR